MLGFDMRSTISDTPDSLRCAGAVGSRRGAHAARQWFSSRPPWAQRGHGTFQSPYPSQLGILVPSVPW